MNYYEGAQPGAVERAIEVMFGSRERRDLEQLGAAQVLADKEAVLTNTIAELQLRLRLQSSRAVKEPDQRPKEWECICTHHYRAHDRNTGRCNDGGCECSGYVDGPASFELKPVAAEGAISSPARPQLEDVKSLLSELADGRPLCDPTMDDPPCSSCAAIFEKFYRLAASPVTPAKLPPWLAGRCWKCGEYESHGWHRSMRGAWAVTVNVSDFHAFEPLADVARLPVSIAQCDCDVFHRPDRQSTSSSCANTPWNGRAASARRHDDGD